MYTFIVFAIGERYAIEAMDYRINAPLIEFFDEEEYTVFACRVDVVKTIERGQKIEQ